MIKTLFDRNDGGPDLAPLAVFRDDDAVSPVIGVILMVAITVILAAVIGAFVLGFGETNETPQATWDAAEDTNASNGYVQNVTLTHRSGDRIEPDTLSVALSGNSTDVTGSTALQAGNEIYVNLDNSTVGPAGDDLLLIYSPEGSTDTSTIYRHTFTSDHYAGFHEASV